jgi:two-component system response regulator LytT
MKADRNGILLVEDEPLISSYISDVLKEFGFEISGCASCAPEAIALAGESSPYLAIVDIQLTGGIDGIEVARVLRDRFGVSTIFLSGVEDKATVARARATCPLGLLKKPFLPSQVLAAVQQAIASMKADTASRIVSSDNE